MALLLFLSTVAETGRASNQNAKDYLAMNQIKKEIHLAGIFPINGVEGWQGGQVSSMHYIIITVLF